MTTYPSPLPPGPAPGLLQTQDTEQYQSAQGCLGLTLLIAALVALSIVAVLIFGVPGQ